MTNTNTLITSQKKEETSGLSLLILPILHLFFTLGFMFLAISFEISTHAFSFGGIYPWNTDDIMSYIFFGYIPIFSSFAILILKKIGVYGLIISFLAYFYFYVVKYFISVIQSNTQYYGNGNILLGILNTILTLPVFLLVFWTLYFYAIKRKWHLFS